MSSDQLGEIYLLTFPSIHSAIVGFEVSREIEADRYPHEIEAICVSQSKMASKS